MFRFIIKLSKPNPRKSRREKIKTLSIGDKIYVVILNILVIVFIPVRVTVFRGGRSRRGNDSLFRGEVEPRQNSNILAWCSTSSLCQLFLEYSVLFSLFDEVGLSFVEGLFVGFAVIVAVVVVVICVVCFAIVAVVVAVVVAVIVAVGVVFAVIVAVAVIVTVVEVVIVIVVFVVVFVVVVDIGIVACCVGWGRGRGSFELSKGNSTPSPSSKR
jgi:hypothetical protein